MPSATIWAPVSAANVTRASASATRTVVAASNAGTSGATGPALSASTFGWARYVGIDGAIVGMETFGASAPLAELQKKFGFTVENVVKKAKAQIAQA